MRKYLFLGLFALASLDLLAADSSVNRDADGLRIVPQAEYAAATVVIDGPDTYRTLRFAAGEPIVIPAPEGDGRFNYEVTLQPVLDAEQRRARAADRDSVQVELPKLAGGFAVEGGSLVTPASEDADAASETGAGDELQATVLSTNDGVIRFSLCVGGDCPASPSFGSDTLRLHENNLRIHFDDTSNSGSFPNNDWRLIANDTTNGGDNVFAIEDATAGRRIAVFEAGAPANALYLDSSGNLGLGTNSPGSIEINVVDGNSPTLRLHQDGSSGFQTQLFDIAANETNFFIRDVTNGSALSFRIQPGADRNTLTLDNEGQVGIGLPDMGFPEANATVHIRARDVAGDDVLLLEDNDAAELMALDSSGDLTLAGTLAQLSRRDSKEHFAPVDHQALLAALKELPIATWNYKHQPDDQRHLGPVAEDFHAAYGLGAGPEHIAASDMAAVALAASQALVREVEARDTRIAKLEDRVARMEAMLQTLMAEREGSAAPTLTSR